MQYLKAIAPTVLACLALALSSCGGGDGGDGGDGGESTSAESPSSASVFASSQAVTAATSTKIPCPLAAGCVEVSRFGYRVLDVGASTFHPGVDFRAGCNTEVFAPAGSIVVSGRSKSSYQAELTSYISKSTAQPKKSSFNAGSTVFLELLLPNGAGVDVKFMHLNDIDSSLLDRKGDVKIGAVVPGSSGAETRVAWTGNTGKLKPWAADCVNGGYEPHLHMEARTGDLLCKGQKCTPFVIGEPFDPFVLMVDRFDIVAPTTDTVSLNQAVSLMVQAKSANGKLVSSDVSVTYPDDKTPPPDYPPIPRFLCAISQPEVSMSWPNALAYTQRKEACSPWDATGLTATGLVGAASGQFAVAVRYDTEPQQKPSPNRTSFIPDTASSLVATKTFTVSASNTVGWSVEKSCSSFTTTTATGTTATQKYCLYTPTFTAVCVPDCGNYNLTLLTYTDYFTRGPASANCSPSDSSTNFGLNGIGTLTPAGTLVLSLPPIRTGSWDTSEISGCQFFSQTSEYNVLLQRRDDQTVVFAQKLEIPYPLP